MNRVVEPDGTAEGRGFVGRHPVACFFVLASGLSLFALLFDAYIAALEPAIKALGVPFRTSLIFALQVYLSNPDTLMGIIGSVYHPLTPTIAALVVVGYLGGWKAVRELLARFRPWQPGIRTPDALRLWLTAMATMMAVIGSTALICYTFAAPGQFTWAPGQFGWLPVWAWFLAGLFTDGGGVGEELGWRGFGSSFLQGKYAPLKAAVFLGLLWAAWHFPARLPELFADPLGWIFGHAVFTIGCIAGTIIMMFFSNKLGGTALIGVMIHSQMNDSFQLAGVLNGPETDLLSLGARTVPEVIAAAIVLYVSKGQLGFDRANPGRRVWTWPQGEQHPLTPR